MNKIKYNNSSIKKNFQFKQSNNNYNDILSNLFNIDVIEQMSKNEFKYHVAHKKANYMNSNGEIVVPDKPNAYKFESFLFDAFERLDDIAILRVKRENEFAPIKNATGIDSPETASELYLNFHKKSEE